MITINSNTRHFSIPGADLVFGVMADSDAERKYFQCPRYVGDNLDLASCFIRINYRNADGKTDFYLVDDMAISGDNITFSWLLSPKVTEYKGQVKFVMCAVGPDFKLKWHTTQGTGQVMEGLEPDNSHVESQTADVVAQLIAMVEAQTVAVEAVGAEQAASVRSAAENARITAVSEIEAKRANSLSSIPNDYIFLNNTVESLERSRAGAIVCDVAGSSVVVDDASNIAIQGLRIFGKSTQDGIPTPDAPVEIKSVESPTVTVCGKNLFDINTMLGQNATLADGVVRAPYYRSLANIPVVKGQQYTISAYVFGTVANTGTLALSVQDGRETGYISVEESIGFVSGVTTTPMLVSLTFTAASNFVSISANASILDNIMVVQGNTAAVFEHYTSGGNVEIARTLHGIPVTSDGNYTDENGQQWICDEVDLERRVYVKRVHTENITQVASLNNIADWTADKSQFTGKLSVNGIVGGPCLVTHGISGIWFKDHPFYAGVGYPSLCVVGGDRASFGDTVESCNEYLSKLNAVYPIKMTYVMETPIETPLTEAEIAAYRNLHSNYQNTTVLNDAGAHMVVKYAADTKLYIDKKIKEALR